MKYDVQTEFILLYGNKQQNNADEEDGEDRDEDEDTTENECSNEWSIAP